MRIHRSVVISAVLVLSVCAATARAAQPGSSPGGIGPASPLAMTLNEDCTATINGVPTPCVMAAPQGPGTAGIGNVPTWTLPENVVSGDVVLIEGQGSNITWSDMVRFVPIAGNPGLSNTVQFYSELPEPGEPPVASDVGVPTAVYAPPAVGAQAVFLPERGACTPYNPLPNTYNICSDVPEVPGFSGLGLSVITLLLLLAGTMAIRRTQAERRHLAT